MVIYGLAGHSKNCIWTEAKLRSIYNFGVTCQSIYYHLARSVMNYFLYYTFRLSFTVTWLFCIFDILWIKKHESHWYFLCNYLTNYFVLCMKYELFCLRYLNPLVTIHFTHFIKLNLKIYTFRWFFVKSVILYWSRRLDSYSW